MWRKESYEWGRIKDGRVSNDIKKATTTTKTQWISPFQKTSQQINKSSTVALCVCGCALCVMLYVCVYRLKCRSIQSHFPRQAFGLVQRGSIWEIEWYFTAIHIAAMAMLFLILFFSILHSRPQYKTKSIRNFSVEHCTVLLWLNCMHCCYALLHSFWSYCVCVCVFEYLNVCRPFVTLYIYFRWMVFSIGFHSDSCKCAANPSFSRRFYTRNISSLVFRFFFWENLCFFFIFSILFSISFLKIPFSNPFSTIFDFAVAFIQME